MDIFEFYQINDSTEFEIAAEKDDLLAEVANISKVEALGEVLRIEENVGAAWKGVRGCCEQKTVDSQAKHALDEWVKKQLFAHRDLACIRYGHNGGRARCGNSGGDWGTPRRCVGSLTIACYIEFVKR